MNKPLSILIISFAAAVCASPNNYNKSINQNNMEEKITMNSDSIKTNDGKTAKSWFGSGERLAYDLNTKKIMNLYSATQSNQLYVFNKHAIYLDQDPENAITFLPGFPDGSIGWIKIDKLIEQQNPLNRTFIEYVGQGDSDKPKEYAYSIFERADLVEAVWKARGIKSTFVITFDYSSLVIMELLRRQQERIEKGLRPETTVTKVLLVNGGYFIDGHSHPIMTTPLLKTRFGKMSTKMAQNSPPMFNNMIKGMWSKDYKVSDEELAEVFDAVTRRDGAFFLHNAAGFVDEHKANGARLDLLSIFQKMKDSVTFHIVGSEKDQFEPRQVKLAKERLGKYGVDIRVIAGGHMITSEQPQLLANIILEIAK
jgi:pimeloyl-ACP methyl ester carboxylesterase